MSVFVCRVVFFGWCCGMYVRLCFVWKLFMRMYRGCVHGCGMLHMGPVFPRTRYWWIPVHPIPYCCPTTDHEGTTTTV